MHESFLAPGIRVHVSEPHSIDCLSAYNTIYTTDAVKFVAELCHHFSEQTGQLYRRRIKKKIKLDESNEHPSFLNDTKHIREDESWNVACVPRKVASRKLDIGDVSPANLELFRKALSSQACGVQVDFDDGHCPTWRNQLMGHYNIHLFIQSQLQGLPDVRRAPALMFRPRAWNMTDHSIIVNGAEVPGSLVDFGLIMFHHAKILHDLECGPFFYLSKLEGYEEARLWNEIFTWSEMKLGVPYASIKACVLIENILASFEMEEILYELRDHSLGLNCGMWDYTASIINKFGERKEFLLPDRNKYVNMQTPFLKSYMRKVIDVCHRRNAHATGGMSAKVLNGPGISRADVVDLVLRAKRSELEAGVDGFLVHDIQLVEPCLALIDSLIAGDDQKSRVHCGSVDIPTTDLLCMPTGEVSLTGLEDNLAVSLQFIYKWLNGEGTFVYKGSVEDSATAEISRLQVWQWLRFGVKLDDQQIVDLSLVKSILAALLTKLLNELATEEEETKLRISATLLMEMFTKRNPPEFITTYLNEEHIWRENHHKFKLSSDPLVSSNEAGGIAVKD